MLGERDTCGLDEIAWQHLVAHAGALARRGPKGDLRAFISAVTVVVLTGWSS